MTDGTTTVRRALVDLFPQFLMRRRRGWAGLQALLEECGLARPAFVLLRAIVEETDPGEWMSEAGLRANLFNPYSTLNPIFEALPALVERGYLEQARGAYAVTPRGRDLIEQTELAARAYLATLDLLPPADLARLADRLVDLAGRMWAAEEPSAKPHQSRARRLPPVVNGAPLVRLEAAIYVLWTARDDAHMAAWRAAGFDGPTLDLLSRLWAGEARTIAELAACLRQSQSPADVEHGVEWLTGAGYLACEGDVLHLTARGHAARRQIEAETDRVYFAPWPALAPDELAWLDATLQTLIDRLS